MLVLNSLYLEFSFMALVESPSSSKLRRCRATAIQRKLFEATRIAKEDPVKEVQHQMEVLLAAVHSLQSVVYGSIIHVPYSMPAPGYQNDEATSWWYQDSTYYDASQSAYQEIT